MSPILCDLHWLPVRQRIIFKTTVLAYKCQHGMAPEYLQVYCQPMSTVACRRLRSADSCRLAVPRKGRATATAVSPSRDRVRGTVFLLNYEHQRLSWTGSDANWRHFYLTCNCDCIAAFSGLAKLLYIMALIIIIIIIYSPDGTTSFSNSRFTYKFLFLQDRLKCRALG